MAGIEFEYWDACVFLALLKGEIHRQGELEYLVGQAEKFDRGRLCIITSTISVTEILDAKFSPDQIRRIKEMYSRSNFQFIDANLKICELASEIRSYYFENPIRTDGKVIGLATPDAIHVASAIVAGEAALQPVNLLTFDSEHNPSRKSMAMTSMTGLVAGKYRLEIERPRPHGRGG